MCLIVLVVTIALRSTVVAASLAGKETIYQLCEWPDVKMSAELKHAGGPVREGRDGMGLSV